MSFGMGKRVKKPDASHFHPVIQKEIKKRLEIKENLRNSKAHDRRRNIKT